MEVPAKLLPQEGDLPRQLPLDLEAIEDGVAVGIDCNQQLHHPDPEARADGASALASIGTTDPAIESSLIRALERADSHEERDTLLQALGQMRSKDAVPVIARLIRSDSTDGDTRTMAVEALGKIARRRFDNRPDPLAAAVEYLDRSGA